MLAGVRAAANIGLAPARSPLAPSSSRARYRFVTALRTAHRLAESLLTPSDPGAEALETCRAGVRLMALRTLGDADLAEEVAQESITRVFTAFRSGEQRIEHLGAFVHGIARHVIADALRAQKRLDGPEIIDFTPSPAPDPLAALISTEERSFLRSALSQLSRPDRRMLRLSFLDGLTPAEVGRRMGEPSLRIRKRKSRALERLRRIFLNGSGHDEGSASTSEGSPEDDTLESRRKL